MSNFKIYSNPQKLYLQMIADIKNAKKYVYLETYIYDNDKTGRKFRDILIKKAKQGVEIKVLMDHWGSKVDKEFFKKLIEAGGKVRFFREFRYVVRVFTKNHERNHRKLLVVDDKISYIGSANITSHCLNWRELVIRLESLIAVNFKWSFIKNWSHFRNFRKRIADFIDYEGFELINEFPSSRFRLTERRYRELIRDAKDKIMIETPYFVPSVLIIKEFERAIKRGVKVQVLLPETADVQVLNYLRNRYLGWMYKKGIEIRYYQPKNLHSKLLIIDDRFFLLGSSNLDYRSFLYQYEINLLGKDKKIIKKLTEFYEDGLKHSRPFNYEKWQHRSSFTKMIELILERFKEYF
jgi:cardiolipin synthase